MRCRLFAALLVPALLVGVTSPAGADLAQPTVVSANPVDFTPNVLDGTVWAIAVVGDTVVVGGNFTKVTDSAKRHTFNRKNLFAYGRRDGVIRPFAPVFDGSIYSLTAGADGSVYAGGAFKTVNGVADRGLVKLSVSSGRRVDGFSAKINWETSAA